MTPIAPLATSAELVKIMPPILDARFLTLWMERLLVLFTCQVSMHTMEGHVDGWVAVQLTCKVPIEEKHVLMECLARVWDR